MKADLASLERKVCDTERALQAVEATNKQMLSLLIAIKNEAFNGAGADYYHVPVSPTPPTPNRASTSPEDPNEGEEDVGDVVATDVVHLEVQSFSEGVKRLKDFNPKRVFTFFFLEDAPAGYQKDLLEKKVPRDKNYQKYSRLRSVCSAMIRVLQKYPEPRPTDPTKVRAWKVEVAKMGEEAQEKIELAIMDARKNLEDREARGETVPAKKLWPCVKIRQAHVSTDLSPFKDLPYPEMPDGHPFPPMCENKGLSTGEFVAMCSNLAL